MIAFRIKKKSNQGTLIPSEPLLIHWVTYKKLPMGKVFPTLICIISCNSFRVLYVIYYSILKIRKLHRQKHRPSCMKHFQGKWQIWCGHQNNNIDFWKNISLWHHDYCIYLIVKNKCWFYVTNRTLPSQNF